MKNVQIIIIAIVSLSIIALIFMVIRPWLKAWSSGVYISIMEIIFMKLRGTPPNLLIEVAMTLKHSDTEYSYQELEVTYMAEKFNISSPKDLFEKHKEIMKIRESGRPRSFS